MKIFRVHLYSYYNNLQYVSSVHKLSYLICIFYLFDQDISNGRKYIYANCIVDCLSSSLYLYPNTQSGTPRRLKALQILGSKLGYAVTFCIFILNEYMVLIELHPLYCSFDRKTIMMIRNLSANIFVIQSAKEYFKMQH